MYVTAGALVLGGLAARGLVRISLHSAWSYSCVYGFPSSAMIPFYISCAYQGGIAIGNRIEKAIVVVHDFLEGKSTNE